MVWQQVDEVWGLSGIAFLFVGLIWLVMGIVSSRIEGRELERDHHAEPRNSAGGELWIALLFVVLVATCVYFVREMLIQETSQGIGVVLGLIWILVGAIMLVYRTQFVPDQVVIDHNDDDVPW